VKGNLDIPMCIIPICSAGLDKSKYNKSLLINDTQYRLTAEAPVVDFLSWFNNV